MYKERVFAPLLDLFTQVLKQKVLAVATHCPPGHKSRKDHEYEIEGLKKIIEGLGCLIRGGDSQRYREGLHQVVEAVDRHVAANRIPEHLKEDMFASRARLLTLVATCDAIDEALDLPDLLPMGRVDKGLVN